MTAIVIKYNDEKLFSRVKLFDTPQNAALWFKEKSAALASVAGIIVKHTDDYYEDNILCMFMTDAVNKED